MLVRKNAIRAKKSLIIISQSKCLLSGNQTWHWKIPYAKRLMRKSSVNGGFSIATLDYQRIPIQYPINHTLTIINQHEPLFT